MERNKKEIKIGYQNQYCIRKILQNQYQLMGVEFLQPFY